MSVQRKPSEITVFERNQNIIWLTILGLNVMRKNGTLPYKR